ncbi:zinc-binding dehydrogenase [Cellulomonas cellasea]|uniref:2-desacetyl-2-hydroxyethyl bacteriochlorophyllide A dehydrogenase n=1 Tax=Cellulomonas cellasea TaxID=43670 RepID=A0A7W4UDK4_9CELL|nr:alcohol dehydrogenase catalytic domain-containing protein [Cellulomonas cellasea]MBB2922227.1 2-desacetyl-2-hydroxyethyl bacteriochlorophyllide A dehydrogenase [Cellulomonas cellasea]
MSLTHVPTTPAPVPAAARTAAPTPTPAPATMRRAVAEPTIGVRLEDTAVPVPGPGEVLVRSTLVGICGSDTHAVAGHHPFLTAPYVPGHEATGVVVGAGPGATAFRPGERVLLKPNVACGTCVNCVAGRSNACEHLTWIGCDPSRERSGAMAGWFVAPERNLFAVPDALDDQAAVLVECLATPVHAVRLAGDLAGARVVVLGAGTIGVLSVVAALRAGAGTVVVTDLDGAKLARAVRVGAAAGVLASSADLEDRVRDALGGPADVVLDCVASERSIAQGVGLLRRAGTLLLVGVPPRVGAVDLPNLQDRELRLQGCAAYTEADVETAIAIAADGGLPVAEVVTATYGLEEAAVAFARAAADSSGKVLVAPGATAR